MQDHKTICDGCGHEAPVADRHGNTDFIKAGWSIPINKLGYYNGFDDNFEDEKVWAMICHDCVLRMLEALPGLKKYFTSGGLHPSDHSAPPCCDHAWSYKRNGDAVLHFRAHAGVWVSVEI